MAIRKKWDRRELLIAFALYCQMPFGRMHSRNSIIIRVSNIIGRTPSALAMKLTNIASLDPEIISSGRKGLSGASNADKDMWEEMHSDWENFALESSETLEKLAVNIFDPDSSPKHRDYSGKTKATIIKSRVGQNFFRKSILSAYNNNCCISGLSVPSLLVASHIVPWGVDASNRLNPHNGLCLSSLHDKAFDIGIITIQHDMTIRVSKTITSSDSFYKETIGRYDGHTIILPDKFQPSQDFLEYHRTNIFKE